MLPYIPVLFSINALLSSQEKQTEPFLLLSIPQDVLSKHLVPHLKPHEQASLASTCHLLRRTVCRTVKQLQFSESGDICEAAHRAQALGHFFPNVQSLLLTVHTLHDTMYAAPLLLMGVVPLLSNLTTVSFTDEVLAQQYEPLEEEMPDIHMMSASTVLSAVNPMDMASEAMDGDNLVTGSCETCEQEVSSHDLCSLLLSLLACAQCSKRSLQKLTLSTKVSPTSSLWELSVTGVDPCELKTQSVL